MKQVFLSGKGEIAVFEVPLPSRIPHSILVQNAFSLISTGTESAAVTKRGGWLGVAEKLVNSREKIERVWQLAQKQGVGNTWKVLLGKLQDYGMIGYSCAGRVIETDDGTGEFKQGDLVACIGVGFANHAEYVVAPCNLAVKLPEDVGCDEAAFGAVACIAQQGIRSLDLSPGEEVLILGLGLIGTVAAQLAKAMGYRVYGVDLSAERAQKVRSLFGIEAWGLNEADVVREVFRCTNNRGVDGVVICAATKSDDPVNMAFDLCRAKGRVSIVGDVGMDLQRPKMYKKELSVRMSCSYGPGRYDSSYEIAGIDYPLGYVRWTERRNLEYFVRLLSEKQVQLQQLISGKFSIDQASEAYSLVKKSDPDVYGVLFDYGQDQDQPRQITRDMYVLYRDRPKVKLTSGRIGLGLIGCGGFAKNVHIPNLVLLKSRFQMLGVAARSGGTAGLVASKYNIPMASSDYRALLDNDQINAVLISTRHASHARMIIDALQAGKHVFVEKPMCLTVEEGQDILRLGSEKNLVVRVGFNRRFAPYLNRLRQAVGVRGMRLFNCRVNVAGLQSDHWSSTREEGGRFLGEGVHFMDLCNWFIGTAPSSISAEFIGEPEVTNPNLTVTIRYPDGSLGVVSYTTLGHARMGKEYYEAFGSGRSGCCDDFKSMEIFGPQSKPKRSERSDKGYVSELEEFSDAIQGKSSSVQGADAASGLLATWMALATLESARQGKSIGLDEHLWNTGDGDAERK